MNKFVGDFKVIQSLKYQKFYNFCYLDSYASIMQMKTLISHALSFLKCIGLLISLYSKQKYKVNLTNSGK